MGITPVAVECQTTILHHLYPRIKIPRTRRRRWLKNHVLCLALLPDNNYYDDLIDLMVTDTRRTEVFTRLSKSGGACAVHTISFASRYLLIDPFDTLSKEQNDRAHSCALHFATVLQIGFIWNPLFLLSAFCIASTAYNTRLHGRALNLRRDPGSVCAVASLIASDAELRTFDNTQYFRSKALLKMLQGYSFYIEKGNVHIDVYKLTPTQARSASTKPEKSSKGRIDPRSVILRSWMASLLLGYLVTLLVIVATFWGISCTTKLHRRLFNMSAAAN